MKKKMPSNSNNSAMMTKEMNDGIKSLLGKHIKPRLKCAVKLESKGEKTENRILVFCPCRVFCLKVPPRIDFHFHYLEIQAIESKKPNQLVLTANYKTHSFVISDPERVDMIDKMIVTLLTSLTETFPGIPLSNIVKRIEVIPASRLENLDLVFDGISSSGSSSTSGISITTPLPYPKSKSTSSLGDEANNTTNHSSLINAQLVNSSSTNLVAATSVISNTNSTSNSLDCSMSNFQQNLYLRNRSSIGPCGGFSTQYAWSCDLTGLPLREEVAWDVDTIYLSHDSRELCLHDFDHLEARDLIPILSALEYNTWFKSVKANNVKLTLEAMDKLLHVIRKSAIIEELHLKNIGAKQEFIQKLSSALITNINSQVHTIDLSSNVIEDKGAIHLSNPISKLCRGPVWLNFSQCGLSAKGVAQLAHALLLNRSAPSTLTYLNLSGNSLKDDINNLCNFLAQPNYITSLDLSGTDCTLETVFGALLRGCTSHLANLKLSRNSFATKKGKELPPSFKQFLTSSLGLKHLSLSSCKLSVEALKQLLLGLACNESTAEVELDISSNNLGQTGAQVLESCLHGLKCLASLDISDNSLESDLGLIVTAASKNKSLKHLFLGRNLQSSKPKYISQVIEAIIQMLQEEDCVLKTLSLADSKLKGELYSVINALGSNQCLETFDITGNQMGDVGARLLAKALQINSKIKCITFDKNNITLQGFSDIAYGLESNTSVRYMPFPIHDCLPCMKISAERTENVMRKIQDLIYRNSQPKKTTTGQQAFRLQQGFLLSSTQQTVDKLVSQVKDDIKLLKKNEINTSSSDSSNLQAIEQAENIIQDTEKAKQLLLNLHEVIEQKGEAGKVVESKFEQLSDELYTMLVNHIQSNVDHVLEVTELKCPHLLGEENFKHEIKEGCKCKSIIGPDFVRRCLVDLAGADIVNKLNEVHLSIAAHISDKLVDRAIDSLMKCHKQVNDLSKKRSSTPDVLKTRLRSGSTESSKDLESMFFCEGTAHLFDGLSPMATPQLHPKRKGLHGRRIRPKSVVDCIEGISADDIPDLLPSLPRTLEELPPVSPQQLKHLGKARPRKPKTRAPTRPSMRPSEIIEEVSDLQEGLDTFFRPGSATPIVTPDSDECTSLLISSMTSAAEDNSIQSTPTHSSKTFKADENNSEKTSPSSFDSCSIASKLSSEAVPRSKSTDYLEKPSSKRETLSSSPCGSGGDADSTGSGNTEGQKSPIQKLGITVGNSVLAEMKARQEKRTSVLTSSGGSSSPTPLKEVEEEKEPSIIASVVTTGLSVSEAKEKFLGGNKNSSQLRARPPVAGPKPRPWSTVGDRRSGEFSLSNDRSGSPTTQSDTPEVVESEGKMSPLTNNQSAERSSVVPGETNSPSSPQLTSLASTVNSRAMPGAININFNSRSKITNNPSPVGSLPTDLHHGSSPVSLPPMNFEKRSSVKELAASLARQQSAEADAKQKKSDSLPRNASPPVAASVIEQPQDFNRARFSIQQWSQSKSVSEVFKGPLRKLSGENNRSSKRWEPNKEESGLPFDVSRLKKVATPDDDVVNV